MNRRKAIRNILLVAGVALAGGSGYEWYHINKTPALVGLDQYKALLDELAETIIPRTDSPGAKDAKVGDFIFKAVRDCADKRAQNKFLYGLQDLEARCQSEYGKSFMSLGAQQRGEVLARLEQDSKPRGGIVGKIQHKFMGDFFFTTLKNYTVIGYATSMQGATQGFAYDYIPGAWLAEVPLRQGQRSWATK